MPRLVNGKFFDINFQIVRVFHGAAFGNTHHKVPLFNKSLGKRLHMRINIV